MLDVTVDELTRLASQGFGRGIRHNINCHIHLPPNFSAFQSAREAVDLAAKEGLTILGTSNYYDFGVYARFREHARRRSIYPLFGVEIVARSRGLADRGVRVNDPTNPGKIYLCGKGITRFHPPATSARRLLDTIRRNDSARLARMIDRLESLFAALGTPTGLTADGIIDRVVKRCGYPREWVVLQERHAAQAFQERFFELVAPEDRARRLGEILSAPCKVGPEDAVRVQEEIRSHLMKAGRPAFAAESFIDLANAETLVLELGGIPCYPVLADGAAQPCEYEADPDRLIEHLKGKRVHCAEFIPTRNSRGVLVRYVQKMHKAGLIVTAGTEHNTRSLTSLVATSAGGEAIPDEIEAIFREGALVVAAHQFLSAQGRCGFVDARGELNPEYGDQESRIQALRGLGAALVARFRETTPDGGSGNDAV